jgi:hypothetical protein
MHGRRNRTVGAGIILTLRYILVGTRKRCAPRSCQIPNLSPELNTAESVCVRALPYRQLAKVLREIGYEKACRKMLIALEEERDRGELYNKPQKALRCLYHMGFR